jgi:hypothetical protein
MNDKTDHSNKDWNGDRVQDDNTPVFSSEPGDDQAISPAPSGRPKILPLVILGALVLICLAITGGSFAFSRRELSTASTQESPDYPATQNSWVKPSESPPIGSSKEAKQAFEGGQIADLDYFILDYPYIPDVNQPGDLYIFFLDIVEESVTLSYGWCALTQEILEDNFDQMKVDFIVNTAQVPRDRLYLYDDEREDGSPCRTYVALLKSLPEGTHRFDIRVTFTQPTHDGWDMYSEGTHTFRYFVTVQH